MSSSTTWPCAALRERDRSRLGRRCASAATREWLLEPAIPTSCAGRPRRARERGLEPRILGGGANLIVDDGLLPGVGRSATERVRRLFRPEPSERASSELLEPSVSAERRSGRARPRSAPGRLVRRDAAAPRAHGRSELGWTGLEGLVGVPGHVGGGVAMNAGGRWGELWDVVETRARARAGRRRRATSRARSARRATATAGWADGSWSAPCCASSGEPRARCASACGEYLIEKKRACSR